jgi:hypothetical protein
MTRWEPDAGFTKKPIKFSKKKNDKFKKKKTNRSSWPVLIHVKIWVGSHMQ